MLEAPTADVSARMKRVRQRDTKPEQEVRRILWRLGLRFRTCVRTLSGSPDIANMTQKWAVFVHGCFWHGHRGCRLATVPKTNRQWWLEKLATNRARDARKRSRLRADGYNVVTVWQCELSKPEKLERKLAKELLR